MSCQLHDISNYMLILFYAEILALTLCYYIVVVLLYMKSIICE